VAKHDKPKKTKAKETKPRNVAKPLPAPTERRSMLPMARAKAAEAVKQVQRFFPPELMPGVVPQGQTPAIAMDYAPGVYDYACMSLPADFVPFPGYPYLSNLSTRAEYRAMASTMASELTREWIKIKSTAEDVEGEGQDAGRIAELEAAIKEFDLQRIFRVAAEQDCYFGRAQISINIKGVEGADKELPLIIAPQTVKRGSLRGFSTIEAMWTTPSAYNSIDPTAPDFYRPRAWFVLGQQVHASRLLTIITRPLPDILKPAYNFGGMSLSQLAEPYVNNWLRTRQSVADLINNFSITALKTDMGQVLQGQCDGSDLFARADMFTLTRSNRGLMLLDKEREELDQVNTPLSGLHELQAQSLEQLCVVSRQPAIVWTGISPSGLNASSDGEIRTFYDWISSQQESFWKAPLQTCIHLIMLHLWGEIDPTITFEFNPLWQTSAKELSDIRVNNANAAATLIDRGVLSQEEVRKTLASDPDSGYAGIDVSDVPELPDEPEQMGLFGGGEDLTAEPDIPAQDKSVSEAQRRAMAAAAEGRSTIGIPQEVGKEFAREDRKD